MTERAAHCLCNGLLPVGLNCNGLLASRLSNALTVVGRRRGRAALLHEGLGDWLEVDGMLVPEALGPAALRPALASRVTALCPALASRVAALCPALASRVCGLEFKVEG